MERPVLVLSRDFAPLNQIDWRRAIRLVVLGVVEVLESYSDWVVHSAHTSMPVPAVLRFLRGARVWRRHGLRLSREAVYARDRGLCSYCQRPVSRADVTLDHVTPRAQGGQTSWTNVTLACRDCNQRKGGRTPEQANMRLREPPVRPGLLPVARMGANAMAHIPKEWHAWLAA